jgi:hypothetical protein
MDEEYTKSKDNKEIQNLPGQNRLSKWLSEVKKKYKIAFYFEIMNFVLSLTCCSLYIFSTYSPIIYLQNKSFFLFMFFARFYFLTDFILTLLTMKSDGIVEMVSYITIEVSTTIPYIINGIANGMRDDFTSSIYMIIHSVITLRIFRVEYLSKYIQSEVNRNLYTITCSIFGLLIFSSAVINVVENTQSIGKYWMFLPRDCEQSDCVAPNPHFHTSFFFIITTVATLGYYSNIHSVAGRILIIILIIISVVRIPILSSDLMKQLTLKSIYSRISYKRLDKVNYIIITGNISYGPIYDLLKEYFHPDHGENERHALILMPQKPDADMKSLLQDYANKLFYYEGDPLKDNDLKRCQFHNASTIILLCNKQTDDPKEEDSRTILLAMAIRNYLKQVNDEERTKIKVKSFYGIPVANTETAKPGDTKMLIQLLRPESELHFALSISKKNNADQILCIDELKLSLLAKSCLCNGIIALVSNLIMTSNLEISDKIMDKNKWLDDYRKGKGYEIYKVLLDFLRGYTFSEICQLVYQEKKLILFGLNVIFFNI